jgi:hypothetical protein
MLARRKADIIARARNPTQAGMTPVKPLIFLCFLGELFSSNKASPIH